MYVSSHSSLVFAPERPSQPHVVVSFLYHAWLIAEHKGLRFALAPSVPSLACRKSMLLASLCTWLQRQVVTSSYCSPLANVPTNSMFMRCLSGLLSSRLGAEVEQGKSCLP